MAFISVDIPQTELWESPWPPRPPSTGSMTVRVIYSARQKMQSDSPAPMMSDTAMTMCNNHTSVKNSTAAQSVTPH